MIQIRRFSELGGGDFGWLKAKHHFTFDASGNPNHAALGSLVVWNDDEIAPGTGFPLHRHRNLEIITYVRQGTVSHQDSVGGVGTVEAGNVQVMSAGTGIQHSEYNAGDVPLKIFQIWIVPREQGKPPRWDTRPFPKTDRSGRLIALASGSPDDEGALPIRGDARVLGGTLNAGHSLSYSLGSGRYAYLVPAVGDVLVNGLRVNQGDGVAVSFESEVTIQALDDAELVLVDAG